MRSEFLASLLVAGVILSGCQTGTANGTSGSNVSNQHAGSSVGSVASTSANGSDKDGAALQESGSGIEDTTINGGDKPPVPHTAKKKPDGWYMCTVATATTPEGKVYVHKTAGILGELKESKDTLDRHDINAFGKATLYVVFPKVEGNGELEDFFSDYHRYNPNDQYNAERQVWTFQVKNETGEDLSNASINLKIDGPYKVYKKKGGVGYEEVKTEDKEMLNHLSLVDLDNHKVYAYNELSSVELSMEGKKVRTFRWVLGGILSENLNDSEVQVLAAKALQRQTAKSSRSLQSVSVKGIKSGGKFGLPPKP